MSGSNRPLRIAVIGAGAGGIAAAVRLRESGIDDITIFEKAHDVGGTWRDNTYPGLACDVPSHLYRFSFAPNPDWSRRYSPGGEIQAYMKKVADEFDVTPLVRFDNEVTSAAWDGAAWRIETTEGDQGRFDAVISAVGVLHHPVYPAIEGLGDFAGAAFHSARWDHRVDLAGKRVGIIGTGSTAVQILPAIVDEVAKVSLFQRTAQWILPEPNPPIREERKAAFRAEPALMAEQYQRLGETFNGAFCAALVGENPEWYGEMQAACQGNLDTVQDPQLKARLTPHYQLGCKRLIVSDRFYPAIQSANAELVTDAIARIEPGGVRTSDGRLHELDVLVLATGFDPHHPMGKTRVQGQDGLTLEEAWAGGNVTYRAVAVPAFPNWFMLGGPYSPIGNFSFLMTLERQLSYVLQLVALLQSGEAGSIAPGHEPTRAYYDAIKAKASTSVWASGCKSWYIDKLGNVASYPWGYDVFERDMSRPELADFEIA